jgi:hypothetical protein
VLYRHPSPGYNPGFPGSGYPENKLANSMDKPSQGTPPAISPREDRLDSWKEIAAYLNRDVTTVQRWEKRENMPVHRHLHDQIGSVYASRAELDAWARSRAPAPTVQVNPDTRSGAAEIPTDF